MVASVHNKPSVIYISDFGSPNAHECSVWVNKYLWLQDMSMAMDDSSLTEAEQKYRVYRLIYWKPCVTDCAVIYKIIMALLLERIDPS